MVIKKEVQQNQNQDGGRSTTKQRDLLYLTILNYLQKGFNPSRICEVLGIKKQKLNYYLSSLKKENYIKKIGYGTWEINPQKEVQQNLKSSHKGSLQVNKEVQQKSTRGHAFIWKVRPNKRIDYLALLTQKSIKYELKGISKTPRIVLNDKKVWLGSNHITIFENKSYFAENTINSKKAAILSFLNDIEDLKQIFGEFKYIFTCRRQHYGFIDNPEAKHFIGNHKKILVKNEKGFWFSIDFSDNLYIEAETIHEQDADIDGLGYQNLMNSHERTKFVVTPDFILNAFNKQNTNINGLIQTQEMLKQNIELHMKVLKGIKSEVGNLGKAIDKFKESLDQDG
jgi:hypothetical protein